MMNLHPILRRTAIALALATLAATGSAWADGADSTTLGTVNATSQASAISPEQRLGESLRVVMMDMIQSGAFGATAPDKIALAVNEPAQRVSNLGLLVDSASAAHARDGLHVLATTPGSAAQRMGLRAGDVLLAVNGTSLAGLGADDHGRAAAATLLREQMDALADGSTVDFRVARNGGDLNLSGPLASVYLPAMHLTVGNGTQLAQAGDGTAADPAQGCGRISQFDVAPRGEHLHGAVIISIDGVSPGPRGVPSFRVSAGTHTLSVGERIESRYLSFNDRLRNANLHPYKTLTVDVAPNTTYFVAARLNPDKLYEAANGGYWDPVIWLQKPESCR